jgi:hypothetical protein
MAAARRPSSIRPRRQEMRGPNMMLVRELAVGPRRQAPETI